MIKPGATLGMLGGGQLGRMFAMAASPMGYRVIVLDPEAQSPAGEVAYEHICAFYDDETALKTLGSRCAVVTTEFENVPAAALELLSTYCPVRPAGAALAITQDRIQEKTFVQNLGIQTTPFHAIHDQTDLHHGYQLISYPAILKTARLGYDGKGQIHITRVEELQNAFSKLGSKPCVLEQKLDLKAEISVIVARDVNNNITTFPIAENMHRNGILHTTSVPATISSTVANQAIQAAEKIIQSLEFCGVLAVEFFIDQKNNLYVNEIAPRTHNSGHYTIDACLTSQFEQHVRMVCGLQAGNTDLWSPVVMINLLGDLWQGNRQPDWSLITNHPLCKLHLYGKHEARPGRKMGHFCCLHKDLNQAKAIACDLFEKLHIISTQ